MKPLALVVILVLVVLAIFSALNWSALTASGPVSVGFATMRAPLGIILLAATGVVTAVFLAFVAYQQAAALVEARRFARELHVHRQRADEAEASRFKDLRSYLETELAKVDQKVGAVQAETGARLGRLEESLVARCSEIANGLSANLAEVEDKIDRALRVGPDGRTGREGHP